MLLNWSPTAVWKPSGCRSLTLPSIPRGQRRSWVGAPVRDGNVWRSTSSICDGTMSMLERLADILHQTGKRLLDSRSTGGFTYRRAGAVVHASVDMDAHHFLVRALSALSPGVPVLSEGD